MKPIEKFRYVCYAIWIVLEPIMLFFLIKYVIRIIKLLEMIYEKI